MKFWKYHGLGNDFIIVDHTNDDLSISRSTIEEICHRRYGIGADGVILAEESQAADIRMVLYNSDGSRASMCGNGIRCFAKYLYDKEIIKKDCLTIETDAGIMKAQLRIEAGSVQSVIIDMGQPDFTANKPMIQQEILIQDNSYRITSLLMGVPHTVLFVDQLQDEMVIELGSQIEKLSLFPQKTNVNFVQIENRGIISIRTWERGAGYTYACGTGACASVAAGVINNLLDEKVLVKLRGGNLQIHWQDRKSIFMEGAAVEVFHGNYPRY